MAKQKKKPIHCCTKISYTQLKNLDFKRRGENKETKHYSNIFYFW